MNPQALTKDFGGAEPHMRNIMGGTDLIPYVNGREGCRIHRSFREVALSLGLMPEGKVGYHPVIREANGLKDRVRCCAKESTLKKDRAFCMLAMSFCLDKVQFNRVKIMREVVSWANGTVMGIDAYGVGYCYLLLFRPEFWFRLARILGPLPLVTDVAMFFRVAGVDSAALDIRAVQRAYFHCQVSSERVSGTVLFSELMGLIELDPEARIGMPKEAFMTYEEFMGEEESEVGSVEHREGVSDLDFSALQRQVKIVDCIATSMGVAPSIHSQVPKTKGFCPKCRFWVTLLDHDSRCRVQLPIVKDYAAQLIGDALHMLDVRRYVVAVLDPGEKYTELVKEYVSSAAQARYMREVHGLQGFDGRSDHTVADEFERLYYGDFRNKYLKWMCGDLYSGSEDCISGLFMDTGFMGFMHVDSKSRDQCGSGLPLGAWRLGFLSLFPVGFAMLVVYMMRGALD